MMSINKPNSTNVMDYEILIRKRNENDYASYCPQLFKMFTGSEHQEVHDKMKAYIDDYILSISAEADYAGDK